MKILDDYFKEDPIQTEIIFHNDLWLVTAFPNYNEVAMDTRFMIHIGDKEIGELAMVMQESQEPEWGWTNGGLGHEEALLVGRAIDKWHGHGF